MTFPTVLLAAAGILLSLLWVIMTAAILASLRQVRPLAELLDREADPAGARIPSLSVIVTARDEAAGIEATVRRLLEQRYPDLEVVVVDDRSTDGTTGILARLAREAAGQSPGAPRLRVVRVDSLPHGWLGKVHACQEGARRAGGDFVLFMDGDVSLARGDLLAGVVGLAERLRIDHVALVPDSRPMSPLQAGLLSLFGQVYLTATLAFEMQRDRRRGGGGIGAFNLIRRSAYDRIGGHFPVRLDVTDDFKIGRLLKESGARQRFYDATGLVLCRWHEGALNVVRGLEKNYFASFDFQVIKVIAFTVVALALGFGPLLIAVAGLAGFGASGTPAGVVPMPPPWLALAIQAFSVALFARRQAPALGARPFALAALYPAAVVLLVAAAWNSTWKTLARGGVRWRDTFYPLGELRRGLVPPGAGRRMGP
ncbi:MAG TPA: glycosyltransferase family 2 protein [Candidatus Polarisedimenticolia bacterium]